jgi:hypothetical protein
MENEERERLDTDRWKSDGNCKYCRRRDYCTKDCKAAKMRFNRICMEFLYERTHLKDIKERLK